VDGDDRIMNTLSEEAASNPVVEILSDVFGISIHIDLLNTIDTNSIRAMTPTYTVCEEANFTDASEGASEDAVLYFVYDSGDIADIYTSPANAISSAFTLYGQVVKNNGTVIWQRGNLSMKNQLMSLTDQIEAMTSVSTSESMESALELMLMDAGYSNDVSKLLDEGNTPYEILEKSLTQREVLDLTGCTLNSMFYYINDEIPVIGALNDGRHLLILGFNESQVVLGDPTTSDVYKTSISEASELFKSGGNRFLTYR